MLAHVVEIIIPKTRPTNHKRREQNLQINKNVFCHMHNFKTNLQSAFNKSEVGKTSPHWIKIDEHYRHTAIVIVSAMKLLGERKQKGKTV